jgi:alkene monooxygenase reductase
VSVGDTLRLRGPFGQFGVRLSHRPIVMVAGGSGMAPIWSMLHDLVATGNGRQVTFLYGARTDRDLLLIDELPRLVDDNDWLTYVPVLSEPDRNQGRWRGETGLVTEALARRFTSLRGFEAYLCGPPPMIDAGVGVITALGCKERHVYFDRFVPTG